MTPTWRNWSNLTSIIYFKWVGSTTTKMIPDLHLHLSWPLSDGHPGTLQKVDEWHPAVVGFFQLNNENTPIAYSCLEYYIGDEMLPSSFPSKQPVQRKVRLFFVAQLFGRWVDVFLCGFAALFTALKLHLLPDVPGSTKFMGQDAYVAVSNPIPDNSDI